MYSPVEIYLNEISKKFSSGHAREHAYRPALQNLVENINPSINAVNDPKQQKVGAPDFVILRGKTPIGYIEAKDININLDKEFKSKNQFNRYKASLTNLCFTNYLEFIFYVNGEEAHRVEVAKLVANKIQIIDVNIPLLESLLKNFTIQKSLTIKTPKELASLMAEKAKMLKNVIYLSLTSENLEKGQVEKQYEVFKEMLIHDLSLEQYADIYAQTVAYGMFAARYHDSSLDTFSRDEANKLLPKSNPFLRNFFQTIAGYNIDDRIVWIVDDLAELFNHVNVKDLLANYGKSTKTGDAIIHFYETFLAEYDPRMRKARGVYYTPGPVVDFIVRAVDDILKKEFNITEGIADTNKIEIEKTIEGTNKKQKVLEHRVQILDPATGTGTFLDKVIRYIHSSKFKGQEGLWQSYVDEHLLPRLHGFELLMASYAMAHLKLDITLAETGYDASNGKGNRIGVYLTNSLEEPESHQRDLFSQWLTTESIEANEVKKEKPIMVIMGNPPYSGISTNNGDWITKLIEDYKYVDGVHFGERKHWLQDDYVKFIRFAEWFVEKNGEGVLAYINPHGFLDNPTFRGMRNHLLKTFDKIYIIDLHGNVKKKESSPDGSKDENVFDIQQGVSINIFVKKKDSQAKLADVYRADVFGKREHKYDLLDSSNINSIRWAKVDLRKPNYLFLNKDYAVYDEYSQFKSVNDLFISNVTGIVTMGDSFAIDEKLDPLRNRIKNLINGSYLESTLKDLFGLGKNYAKWILSNKDKIVLDDSKFVRISYRPFDDRYTYFDNKILWRWREDVMKNFLRGENIGLIFPRQAITDNYSHINVSRNIIDNRYQYSNKGIPIEIPLYLYNSDGSRKLNIDPSTYKQIANNLGMTIPKELNLTQMDSSPLLSGFHKEIEESKESEILQPEDILDYIYAILHSPTYRERYKEFLKIDFPRVPFTMNKQMFSQLVEKGRELRKYHLMEHEKSNELITKFPIAGENEVVNIKYENSKVWINNEQYFEGVSVVAWEFYIGGYQPAQKWLKDRKGRKLSFEDIVHYQKIIVALVGTDKLMKEIDKIVEF